MTMTSPIFFFAILFVIIAATFSVRNAGKRRQQIRSLANNIITLRRLAMQPPNYRPLCDQDAALWKARDLYEATARELGEHGFAVVGDRAEVQPDGTSSGITRWFVDSSSTVCGWFGVIANKSTGQQVPAMMFFSQSARDEFFVTIRSSTSRHVTVPPNLHRQFIPWQDGFAAALERHRTAMQQRNAGELQRIDGIDGALFLLKCLRDNTTRWRVTQPAETLLDADLRSVLQERYNELHTAIRPYLKDEASVTA